MFSINGMLLRLLLLPLGLLPAVARAGSGPIIFARSGDTIAVVPLADDAVRVQHRQGRCHQLPEWTYVKGPQKAIKWTMKRGREADVVRLKGLTVTYHRQLHRLSFATPAGQPLFSEQQATLRAASVQGEPTWDATLAIDAPEDEALFGLGQFQDGWLNVSALPRRLTQVNTQIAIPMVYSSRGFALLWNNYGLTDFNLPRHHVALLPTAAEGDATEVDVTTTEGGRREKRQGTRFEATISVPVAGRYALLLDVGQTMARAHQLAIDGREVMQMKNLWLPPTASTIVSLEAGTHQLSAVLEKDDRPTVYYQPVETLTTFHSPVANAVDYTVFAGEADRCIAAYRDATGPAPLMPAWALGYIHCRERFHSSQEILATARRMRREGYPMDVIVQDWQYWGRYGWNAMRFDERHYPDPRALTDTLHQMGARMMLSVWSKVDPESEVGADLQRRGLFLPHTSWVDFFNPRAAEAYWHNFSQRLLPTGVDAWWQDATEPENDDLLGRRVNAGKWPGELVRNVYPLLVARTVYGGLRADQPDRRPMILTRSGFPGMQRYGAAVWSGDVGHDWTTLRRQLTGGLGLSITGLPWWTYDAGGFFRPADQHTNAAYQEVMLRWLQAAVYLPLMRVHGYMSDTEPWCYADTTAHHFRRAIEDRYRLLPYLYAANADVAFRGGTLLRPLVMDFRTDARALQQNYEFMCGKALLVAPVVAPGISQMVVYLPPTPGGWYDFYTGRHVSQGGEDITVDVHADRIPVFVRAGSIVPMAEPKATVAQTLAGDIKLCVYPGADGETTLYYDDLTTNAYERGQRATQRIVWDDRRQQLVVLVPQGGFDGFGEPKLTHVVMGR